MTITITGTTSAYYVTTSNSALVLNAGTVRGSSGATVGIKFTTGTQDVLTVSGTVQGTAGLAIYATNDTVTIASGGYIHGLSGGAVFVKAANDVIVNGGKIISQTSTDTGISVLTAGSGAIITNLSTGTISGPGNAIFDQTGATATIVNYGLLTMNGSYSYGVLGLYGGGNVFNKSAGVINAAGESYGVSLRVAGTITNAGTIKSVTGEGVISVGGLVANYSTGLIDGSGGSSAVGVSLTGAGTVTNAGTIKGGSSGDSVQFSAVSGNRLIDYASGVFTGKVDGGTSSATLELHSSASAGTLSNLGVSFTNFGTVQFDAGSSWIAGGNSAGVTPVTFSGFGSVDTINVTGFTATSVGTAVNHQSVTLNSGASHVTLHFAQSISSFGYTTGAFGTDITTLCFCTGTLIRTPNGEVQVEKLAVGETVTTIGNNGTRVITWIGRGKIMATRGQRGPATPVIVRKGSIANNTPHVDLHVTKAHGIFVDGVLIPAEFLVNHRSIVWDDRAQEVSLYHIELDGHDILYANGAQAESYRDDGNRWLFQNAREGSDLPPQKPCARVLTGGPIVDKVWRRLLDRAGPRALPPMTDDPDLHLIADGTRINAAERRGQIHVFRLTSVPERLRIVSRDVVPAELGIARDPRSLGVALRRIMLRQGTKFVTVEASDARLTDGFQTYESRDDLRWTNGGADLPLAAFARFRGPVDVVLTVAATTTYPDHGFGDARRVA